MADIEANQKMTISANYGTIQSYASLPCRSGGSKFQSLVKVQSETLECTLDDLLIAPTDPMWLKRAEGKD